MMYYFNEDYILPLSHDETVHGKATILQKMNGEYENKFPQARAFYMYMYAHPGKKLNFMGNEIGQLREWDEKREQDWSILKYPIHDAFHRFMKELIQLYLEHPSLYENDYSDKGFRWLDCHQEECCIYAFERICKTEKIAAVFNFSGQAQKNYPLHVGKAVQALSLLISSDMEQYGGTTRYPCADIPVENGSVTMDLPPYSAMYFFEKIE